jgi:uncharacterized membrane protein
MSVVEVSAEIEIAAAPADIAAVMFDPQREPDWMRHITAVHLIDQALEPGARVTHTASVFGREVSWSSEVEAVHFPHLLQMKIAEGPFSGTLRYDIQRSGDGSRVRIRGAGEAQLPMLLPASMVTGPVSEALSKDLQTLKSIVESA